MESVGYYNTIRKQYIEIAQWQNERGIFFEEKCIVYTYS